MRLLLVSATPFEILPLQNYLAQHFQQVEESVYQKEELSIHLLITGVGQMLTAFALGSVLSQQSFDLLLNVGVAGTFNRKMELGTVVHVISERFGDLGAEDQDGSLLDMQELGLLQADSFPFRDGKLINPSAEDYDFLPKVHSLSVNKVHGSDISIARIQKKYTPEVESMEGIAFFYAALKMEVPFLEIRAISNYVEARNRENWKLELAIDNLNQVLVEMVNGLGE